MILGAVWIIAFSSRLFSVIRFESVIHEFDPWFNYRATKTLVESGFYDFVNWFERVMAYSQFGLMRLRGILWVEWWAAPCTQELC